MRSMQQFMAGNSLANRRQSDWTAFWSQAAFTGLLFLVFVSLQPFAPRDDVEAQLSTAGEGDLSRQISYILGFAVVLGFAFILRGQKVFKSFPVPLVLVLFWCLLSIGWAIEPGIAARRLGLTTILVASVMCGVDMLGTKKSLESLRFVLIVVMVVDLVSVFVVPQAVHFATELEAELAGNWRGLHYHKNIAGPIAALAALLFYHYGLATRRYLDWFMFLVSIIFMYGTQSKTALGFFVACLAISTTYRLTGRTTIGRQVFNILIASVLGGAIFAWVFDYHAFDELMSDPTAFTGRVAIWQTVFNYLHEHWILGSGFGSFWQIGESSPVFSMAAEKWVRIAAHSHNGYLEILATTGAIGLGIAVIALVIIPLVNILDPQHRDIELQSLLLALFSFIILANLFETIFLNRDRPEWRIYLIVLAILHRMPEKSSTFEKRGGEHHRQPSHKQPR